MLKTWLECDYLNQSILGIDEAGRGPLAGPCVVVGLVLPKGFDSPLIYDSKKLSPKKRRVALDLIMKEAVWIMIVTVSPQIIDRDNIYRATQKAMQHIAEAACVDVVFTDAMPLSIQSKPVYDFIKGDQRSISIAAASIVAKEMRDSMMEFYDQIYPEYGFKQHKGYPTKTHIQALFDHGITPIHRLSFHPVSTLSQTTIFDQDK